MPKKEAWHTTRIYTEVSVTIDATKGDSMAYIIQDQRGTMLGSGQTREQVVRVYQRLISDSRATLPRLPKFGHELVIALPSAMAAINQIDALYIVHR